MQDRNRPECVEKVCSSPFFECSQIIRAKKLPLNARGKIWSVVGAVPDKLLLDSVKSFRIINE